MRPLIIYVSALAGSILNAHSLPSGLVYAHGPDDGHYHWATTQSELDQTAEAALALKLLGVHPDVAEATASSFFYIRYHFETGAALSWDPVEWALQLPHCRMFGEPHLDCDIRYNTHDGHWLSSQEREWCQQLGGGEGWDCGGAGEGSDVNPEAAQKAEDKARSRCQAIAVRVGRDPKAC